jgi:hypothetical protein
VTHTFFDWDLQLKAYTQSNTNENEGDAQVYGITGGVFQTNTGDATRALLNLPRAETLSYTNLFHRTGPLAASDVKRIRPDLFVKLRDRILGNGISLALTGSPKMGKSSLLEALNHYYGNHSNLTVYISFRLESVATLINKTLQVLGSGQETIAVASQQDQVTLTANLKVFSDEVEAKCRSWERPLYLFLDDLDNGPDQGFSLEVANTLKTLMEKRLVILITASKKLPAEILPDELEWYNYLVVEALRPLHLFETKNLLKLYLPSVREDAELYELWFGSGDSNTNNSASIGEENNISGLTYHNATALLQMIYSLTEGHPFQVMRALYRWYDWYLNQQHNQVNQESWLKAYEEDLSYFEL